MTRWLVVSLVLAVVSACVGCSTRTIESSPLAPIVESEEPRSALEKAEREADQMRADLSSDRVNLWPIYYRARSDKGLNQSGVWPLVVWFRSGGESETACFPLLYYRAFPEEKRRFVLTPLGFSRRNGDSKTASILWPVWIQTGTPEHYYKTALFPIYHDRRTKEGRWRAIAPLYLYHRESPKKWQVHTLPVSYGRTGSEGQNRKLNVGLLLTTWEWGKDLLSWNVAGIAGGRTDVEGKRGYFFPVYRYRLDESVRDYTFVPLLAGSYRATREHAESRLPEWRENTLIWTYESPIRRWNVLLAGACESLAIDVAASNEQKRRVVYERRSAYVFPLYDRDVKVGMSRVTKILFGTLYTGRIATPEGQPEIRRQAVLYRLFRRTAEADRVRGEVFPFIAWDTSPERRRWGFAGGFVGYASDAKSRRFRLLYIPIWRGKSVVPPTPQPKPAP